MLVMSSIFVKSDLRLHRQRNSIFANPSVFVQISIRLHHGIYCTVQRRRHEHIDIGVLETACVS